VLVSQIFFLSRLSSRWEYFGNSRSTYVSASQGFKIDLLSVLLCDAVVPLLWQRT